MGRRCVLQSCDTRLHSRTATRAEVGASFFSFPKDPEVRKKWLEVCGLTEAHIKKNSKICSKHFHQKDVCISFNNQVTVKKSAVPLVCMKESIVTMPKFPPPLVITPHRSDVSKKMRNGIEGWAPVVCRKVPINTLEDLRLIHGSMPSSTLKGSSPPPLYPLKQAGVVASNCEDSAFNLQEKLTALNKENAVQREELAAFDQENAAIKKNNIFLIEENTVLRMEKISLEQELNTMVRENKNLNKANIKLQENLKKLQDRMCEKNKRCRTLAQRVRRHKFRLDRATSIDHIPQARDENCAKPRPKSKTPDDNVMALFRKIAGLDVQIIT